MQREAEITRLLEFFPVPAYYFAYRRPRFVAVNQLFCELLGYSEQHILNTPWQMLLPENERAAAEAAIAAARIGQFPETPVRWTFLRADGTTVSGTARVRETRVVLNDREVVDTHFVALVAVDGEETIESTRVFGTSTTG